VCPFHQHEPTLLSGALLVMHFGNPKVHFIRLKAWFYVKGTLNYEKILFSIPQKSLISVIGSLEFQFLKAQVCVPFSSARANFIEWCIACYAFWQP